MTRPERPDPGAIAAMDGACRQALVRASDVASAYHHREITGRDIIAGLVRQRNNPFAETLRGFGDDTWSDTDFIERLQEEEAATTLRPGAGYIPFSPGVVLAIRSAHDISRGAGRQLTAADLGMAVCAIEGDIVPRLTKIFDVEPGKVSTRLETLRGTVDIVHMDIGEFVRLGYLQEVNRLFLHPRGLALEAVQDFDGTWRLGGIWDYRTDPEGMAFGPTTLTAEKAQEPAAEYFRHLEVRQTKFGTEDGVQPLP